MAIIPPDRRDEEIGILESSDDAIVSKNLEERVRLIGGNLTVHPNPNGNGTSVLVTLPLNEEALAPSQNTALNPDAAGDEDRFRAQGLSL
jgi:hypothetical protein